LKEEREHGDGREKLEIFQWKKCANMFFFLVLNASYLLKKNASCSLPDPLVDSFGNGYIFLKLSLCKTQIKNK
jgi:hypothetical protein